MKTQPGDQLQIVLTVGGVPYAKTRWLKSEYSLEDENDRISLITLMSKMQTELMRDIIYFGDEHEKDEQV